MCTGVVPGMVSHVNYRPPSALPWEEISDATTAVGDWHSGAQSAPKSLEVPGTGDGTVERSCLDASWA